MVVAFVNKYRYFIYFVIALGLYLFSVEVVNDLRRSSIRPTYAERIEYTCSSGKVSMIVLMNSSSKALLFIDTTTAQGATPYDFSRKYGQCIMFERNMPFTVSPEVVSQYIPMINKANEEGQYE